MSKQLFKRLKDFRKKQGLSIAQLCEQIGAHYTTYNRWKNANKIIGPYKKIVENFLNKNVGLGLDFKNKSPSPVSSSDIAVIGISCYYPGASNVKELWENILSAGYNSAGCWIKGFL